MDRYFKPVSPSTKARLGERAAERSREIQQRFDERDAAFREAREEERKEAEMEAPPQIRKKPRPKNCIDLPPRIIVSSNLCYYRICISTEDN
jgi:hypothetical protein